MGNRLSREVVAKIFYDTLPNTSEFNPAIQEQMANDSARESAAREAIYQAESSVWNQGVLTILFRAGLNLLRIRPFVPRELEEELESAKKQAAILTEQQRDLLIILRDIAANLPGIHGLLGLSYHPSDPNGTTWHTRMSVEPEFRNLKTHTVTTGTFAELRYQTIKRTSGDEIYIPKSYDLSPTLLLPEGRNMYVGVVSGPNNGAYSWTPQATRKALLVNPNEFVPQ